MKKNYRIPIACGVAGLFALACVLAALHLTRSRPPVPQAASPEQMVGYLASAAFARMAPDDKREYIRSIQVPGSQAPVFSLVFNPSVPQEQRRRVMQNVLPVVGPLIDQRLDEFDRLPPAAKTARLDAFIDQLQEARRENQGMASSVERLNLVIQYVDPRTRAKMRKHIPALMARMKERGIQGVSPW
jgi:hypothetical protein